MTRAVIYLRVSTEEQAAEGHSIDAQRTNTTTFVTARGWTLVGEYVDAGYSAKARARRPAFERLLQDAERGLFDVVVVDEVDRFYRHLRGLLTTLDLLRQYNVTFASVQEQIDLTTPWGKLTLTILGILAEIYIDNLRQETRKGCLARARKGLWNGHIPFGYCDGRCSSCEHPNGPGYCPYAGGPDRNDDPERLIPHPIESEAVRRAFAWYASGAYSDARVAERLNHDGVTWEDGHFIPFRSRGHGKRPPGRFSKGYVRDLLQRVFYTGVVPYYGRDERDIRRKRAAPLYTFPGKHPSLVDEETFRRAQEVRRQAYRKRRDKETGMPQVHPLSGLLICDTCGRVMRATSVNGGRDRYYRDTTRLERLGECDQPNVPAEHIEAQVVHWLASLQLPPDWRERARRLVLSLKEQENLAQQEQVLRLRLERLKELYLAGDISREEYQQEKRRTNGALANLVPGELSAILGVGELLANFSQKWEEAKSLQKKHELLRGAVAGARVKGYRLVAVHVTQPLYPLITKVVGPLLGEGDPGHCLSGPDGT